MEVTLSKPNFVIFFGEFPFSRHLIFRHFEILHPPPYLFEKIVLADHTNLNVFTFECVLEASGSNGSKNKNLSKVVIGP